MTAQYCIRNGLSLIIVPGTDATLSAHAYLGYPHLGSIGSFRGR
jgi:hypothetical protein